MFRIFLFLIIVHLPCAFAIEKLPRGKKYNLSICAIFKNEKRYLKEWIEYHRLVGVDHFYLYDNNSVDRPNTVLQPYIKAGIVTLIAWPDALQKNNDEIWALSTQVSAYENATKFRALNQTKWLVIIDIDEYLLPANAEKLTDILDHYDRYPGVILSRDFYDVSRVDQISKKKLLIENLNKVGEPEEENIWRDVEKTIFKPELCETFTWPPFKYEFKNSQLAVRVNKYEMRINNYINRNMGFTDIAKLKEKLRVNQKAFTNEELEDLLERGYEIEDQERTIYRYIPEMLQKMGYPPIW